MIYSYIWHKYHLWYFKIVSNFTRLTAREIMSNDFEISLVVFVPNITINHPITYTNRPFSWWKYWTTTIRIFFFLPSYLNLLNQYAISTFPIMHLISPPKKFCVSITFSRFFRPVSTCPESFASVQPVLIITVFWAIFRLPNAFT